MDHVAIMSKYFGDIISKILTGEKKIESRWSKYKISPWGRIKPEDTIYFKNSGQSVTAKAKVIKIEEFENLTPKKIRNISNKWGGKDGINITNKEETYKWALKKNYCLLIFLKNPQQVKPFKINKKGFGAGAAWICVGNINKIRV